MITNRNIASNAAGFRIHFEQVRSSLTCAQPVIDPFLKRVIINEGKTKEIMSVLESVYPD